MAVQVKICGIKTPEALSASVEAGARFIGFVFYPPSPRHVEIDIAFELVQMLPTGVWAVGLFVDPTDEQLAAVTGRVQLDMIQLHGAESKERVEDIKQKFGLPVMKALAIGSADDLQKIAQYEEVVDWVLCDTPSPQHGGSGQSFDWSLLKGYEFQKPWMLAGGLKPENVGEAIKMLHPTAIDVSSGVESARGVKDETKIQAFLAGVKGL